MTRNQAERIAATRKAPRKRGPEAGADAGEPEEAKSAVARAGASLANQSPAAQREQFESRRIVWHYSGAACQRLASRVVRRICLRAGAMAA